LAAGDLPLLADWLRDPRVARWWSPETTAEAVERDFGPGTRGEEPGEDLVVPLDERPIGLLQHAVTWETLGGGVLSGRHGTERRDTDGTRLDRWITASG
jgi:Acetyltransferase (GNAT) domain